MIRLITSLVLGVFISAGYLQAQITVDISTLPEVGTTLEYSSFSVYEGEGKYNTTGEDLVWDFTDVLIDGEEIEEFQDPSNGEGSAGFPDADMLVSFIGGEGYAIKNSTSISVIGFYGEEFGGLPVPLTQELSQPFVIRRAPLAFGDQYSTSTSFDAKFPLSDFPDLDTLIMENNPLGEGVEIDSFAIQWDIEREENVIGWGTVTLDSGDYDVLQVVQDESIVTNIEAYIVTVIGGSWIDIGSFLPEEFAGNLEIDQTTYRFLTATDKTPLIEFTEQMVDEAIIVNGRGQRGLLTSNKEIEYSSSIQLYPNPASDFIHIDFDLEVDKVEIYSEIGSLIKTFDQIDRNQALPIGELTSGAYYIKLQSGNKEYSQRFIIVD